MNLLHGDALDELAWLGDCSIDALVTDPPAGIEFMGKAWDSFKGDSRQPGDANYPMSQSGPHKRMKVRHGTSSGYKNVDVRENFIRSLTAVFRECLRVMKPGAHGLVWALPRTSHWTATALEDAGFEVRDVVTHHFGTGFPKSLNVGKAIDKVNGETGRMLKFTAWMRTTGITAKQLDEATGTNMGGHYLTSKSQPAIPTRELFEKIRPLVACVPAWVDELIERVEAEREVTGERDVPVGHAFAGSVYGGDSSLKTVDVTAPATDVAKQWEGFGTALKPASEHWILVRKPLVGTVAANVLEHGTGVLNIEGCRIGTEVLPAQKAGQAQIGTFERTNMVTPERTGRWPANVALSHLPDCVEECAPGCPVAELDRQSGVLQADRHRAGKYNNAGTAIWGHAGAAAFTGRADSPDGASRFFYVSKPSKKERGEGNDHPTIKGIALMRWLVRLITPPGGMVLDPFMGSGTTGLACLEESMDFVGIEQDEHYFEIASKRLADADFLS